MYAHSGKTLTSSPSLNSFKHTAHATSSDFDTKPVSSVYLHVGISDAIETINST